MDADAEEDIRRATSDELLDRVCAEEMLAPDELLTLGDDELVAKVRARMPEDARGLPVEVARLRRMVRQYVADCAAEVGR